jgi:hypothetical protein
MPLISAPPRPPLHLLPYQPGPPFLLHHRRHNLLATPVPSPPRPSLSAHVRHHRPIKNQRYATEVPLLFSFLPSGGTQARETECAVARDGQSDSAIPPPILLLVEMSWWRCHWGHCGGDAPGGHRGDAFAPIHHLRLLIVDFFVME